MYPILNFLNEFVKYNLSGDPDIWGSGTSHEPYLYRFMAKRSGYPVIGDIIIINVPDILISGYPSPGSPDYRIPFKLRSKTFLPIYFINITPNAIMYNSMQTTKIDLNPLFKKALDIMETSSKNAFITGKAGTGKSTLLQYFRMHTKKRVVVLAPTGVAAINVQGETIHSFFRFKPNITLNKVKKIKIAKGQKSLYKELDAIIIDEISMVRADLLDCVDKFLRLNGPKKKKPFGGIQMIFIGDLYQLPPVVTSQEKELFLQQYQSPYFFAAESFENLQMEYIELEKIYRQKDQVFINLLNHIRKNLAAEDDLELINQRFDPDFEPKDDDFYIHLTTTNKMANELNEKELKKLKTKLHAFQGEISGEIDPKQLPTDLTLNLKIGSQIMLLNNDGWGRWVNGTIGKIVDILEEHVLVELADGTIEEVSPFTWEIFHFNLNQLSHQLEAEVVGKFTQLPLRLAWAITIHKSQGKTFDKVILDIGKGTFAHGQLYVALSRCRSLAGIILKKKVKKSHIIMDYKVINFVTKYQYKQSDSQCPLEQKIRIIEQAILENKNLELIYLKTSDEKSQRIIKPFHVGEMEYQGKTFLGVKAFCLKRNEERVFRIDRILELLS
jgi:ATP-dependent DNA helicase PIF1